MREEKLLDILRHVRMGKALDNALSNDRDYQCAVRRQEAAFGRMDKMKLSSKQNKVVDRAISATNHCGAVYGEAAYRLGLHDGMRLVSEIKKIE